MALSSCPKCGGHRFEMVTKEPSGSKFKVQFIQCASCGCVVGTSEYYNIGALLHKLAEKLNINLS